MKQQQQTIRMNGFEIGAKNAKDMWGHAKGPKTPKPKTPREKQRRAHKRSKSSLSFKAWLRAQVTV